MTIPQRSTKRLDVDLDPALKKRLRMAACEDERTMKDIIGELVEGWLDDRDYAAAVVATTAPERSPLPVQPPVRNAVHPEVRTTSAGTRIPIVRPLPATHPARRT